MRTPKPPRLRLSMPQAPAWLLALALAGCAAPPPGDVPALEVPAAWRHNAGAGAGAAANPAGPDWWQRFGSSELATLVGQAGAGSFDLAAAAARVRQAQAQARIAGAALLPEVSLGATAQRLREPQSSVTAYYTAELFASYEIDLWGGNAAARDSALATLQSTARARDTVALTLTAAVAASYLQAAALRERVDIARRNLATAERILALVASRARAGAATPLELAQQRGLVATQRQDLEQRRQQARSSLTALAILLGRPVQGFDIAAGTLDGIAMPAVAAGVPAGLIVHRPDLAQAERALAAADADIVAARAAMLPALTLTAGAGVGADRLRDLPDTSLYSLAAGLAAPIFNAGRLAAGRDFAIARREELLAAYRGAIVNAFGDVENALNAVDGLTRQRDAQAEALAQAKEAARLAESRYRAGAETLLTVLDAQRTLYTAQDDAVQLHLAQLQAGVGLFRALGGGWEDNAAAAGRG
ncbi:MULTISPECIES: efflux transporter outer membrane subunit [Cupriavidus]